MDGGLLDNLQVRARAELRDSLSSLRPEEAAVLAFLQNVGQVVGERFGGQVPQIVVRRRGPERAH